MFLCQRTTSITLKVCNRDCEPAENLAEGKLNAKGTVMTVPFDRISTGESVKIS